MRQEIEKAVRRVQSAKQEREKGNKLIHRFLGKGDKMYATKE